MLRQKTSLAEPMLVAALFSPHRCLVQEQTAVLSGVSARAEVALFGWWQIMAMKKRVVSDAETILTAGLVFRAAPVVVFFQANLADLLDVAGVDSLLRSLSQELRTVLYAVVVSLRGCTEGTLVTDAGVHLQRKIKQH